MNAAAGYYANLVSSTSMVPDPQRLPNPPQQFVASMGVPPPQPVTDKSLGTSVLKLKGLPYNCRKEDVLEFFSEFKVQDVRFVYDPDGRASGLGFVDFETKEDARRALKLNRGQINNRCVKLLMVPKREMEAQSLYGTLAVPGPVAEARLARLWNKQAEQRSRSVPAHSSDTGAHFATVVPGMLSPDGVAGSGLNEMPHYAAGPAGLPRASMGVSGVPKSIADPYILPEALTEESVHRHLHRIQQHRTIYIRGLPFKATPEEVLEFFNGLDVLPDSLRFKLDALGRFTGEALISCETPEQAIRAVQSRNRMYLRNRYLELSVC